MNERIIEMAEQAKLRPALLLKHWGTIDALTDSEQEELSQLEQFAELIVRECVEVVKWTPSQFPNDEYVKNITEHFGVEE